MPPKIKAVKTRAHLKCPECLAVQEVEMPLDYCQFFSSVPPAMPFSAPKRQIAVFSVPTPTFLIHPNRQEIKETLAGPLTRSLVFPKIGSNEIGDGRIGIDP